MSAETNADEIARAAVLRKWDELVGKGLTPALQNHRAGLEREPSIRETARRIVDGQFNCFVRRSPDGVLTPAAPDDPLMIEVRAFVANRGESIVEVIEATRINYSDMMLARRRDTWNLQASSAYQGPIREKVLHEIKIDPRWEKDLWLRERLASSDAAPAIDLDAESSTVASDVSRREQQLALIELAIRALRYADPLALPKGAKKAIRDECLKFKDLFTPAGFDHAWKIGASGAGRTPRFALADRAMYADRK